MALWDEVELRYNEEDLVALTNAGRSRGSSTVFQPRADAAVVDVEAAFNTHAHEPYDESLPQHVEVAVEGVVARLEMFAKAGDGTARGRYDRFIERLGQIAMVRQRARVEADYEDGVESDRPGPAFPDSAFDDLVPDPPRHLTTEDA